MAEKQTIKPSELEQNPKTTTGKNLVLYNDDFHSFDFVIETLMEVCNHPFEQAEQCTMIAHYKGKCDVKNGTFEELLPMQHGLVSRGLIAKIE